MLDIKELTWEHHKNAERQEFVKILMSGKIDEKLYATYLYNQLQCYSVLEKYGLHNSLFRDTPGLLRAEHIHYDYRHLWTDIGAPPEKTQSTKEYIEHIESIQDEAMKLYAHIYVRHMGDLSGGQMIMKKTPGPNRYYRFKHKEVGDYKRIVKETINTYLNVYEHTVVPEARLCFNFATRLFKEMIDYMSRNVVDIFSVPLCIETQVYDISQEELNYLKSLDTRETPNNKISQDIFVGNNNKLSKLMNIIDYYVENYKSEVLQIDNEIYRTQSWLAVSKKGQSHHEHEHPNTFISAVFYVNCNSGDLVLKRPRSVLQDGFNFSYKIKKFTPANCRKWSVPLKTGDLAIFPAWITHFTYENEDDNDRIILGVNYFLKGQIGTEKGVDIIRI